MLKFYTLFVDILNKGKVPLSTLIKGTKGGKMKTEKTEMKCNECGHSFKKTIKPSTYEVKCPKCKGYDTEPR